LREALNPELIKTLSCPSAPIANFYTPLDLATAAINGLETKNAFALPEDKLSLVVYCINHQNAIKTGKPLDFEDLETQTSELSRRKTQVTISSPKATLFERWQLLQTAARVFSQSGPDSFIATLGGQLVGNLAALKIMTNQEAYHVPPMLTISYPPQKDNYQIKLQDNLVATVELTPNKSILIPGAGLTSLGCLENLSKLGQKVILNDLSSFVTKALESATTALSYSNIQVQSGDWSNLNLDSKSVEIVLCSLLQEAGPEGIRALFKKLTDFATTGATAVIYNRKTSNNTGSADIECYLSNLREGGWNVKQNKTLNVNLLAPNSETPNSLLNLSSQDLYARIEQAKNGQTQFIPFSLIVATKN
jgi:hypothetical protein